MSDDTTPQPATVSVPPAQVEDTVPPAENAPAAERRRVSTRLAAVVAGATLAAGLGAGTGLGFALDSDAGSGDGSARFGDGPPGRGPVGGPGQAPGGQLDGPPRGTGTDDSGETS